MRVGKFMGKNEPCTECRLFGIFELLNLLDRCFQLNPFGLPEQDLHGQVEFLPYGPAFVGIGKDHLDADT